MQASSSSSRNRPHSRTGQLDVATPAPAPEHAVSAEVWAWLRRAEDDFQAVDPVRMNHAMLEIMEEVASARGLPPCEVQRLTGLTYQHQRKLHPAADMLGETRVTFFTVILWSNGMGLNPLRVMERLLEKARP